MRKRVVLEGTRAREEGQRKFIEEGGGREGTVKAGLGASCGRVVTDNPRDTTQRVVVGVAEKVIAAQMVFILDIENWVSVSRRR